MVLRDSFTLLTCMAQTDGNASPKTVSKVKTRIPGRDSKITDLMEGDLPAQSACAPSSLYLDMTVLASKRRKFRHCGLPKEQAECFQGEGLDCQQFDVCKHCQKISSNLHHVSGEGGGVLLCSACRCEVFLMCHLCLVKVMIWIIVSESHKVMTALIVIFTLKVLWSFLHNFIGTYVG